MRHLRYAGDTPRIPMPLEGDSLMHPEGVTLIYGQGGIGKGMISIHVIKHLIAEGHNPLVLDYESNAWEWDHRAYSMGIRFAVVEPESNLSMIGAVGMAADIKQEGFTHIILDSATAAKPRAKDNDFGAADSTRDFFKAMRLFGLPILLIGHQGKAQKNITPLGSVHFVTQSRLVYHAVSSTPGRVRLICEKANDRDKTKLGAEFVITGDPTSLTISRNRHGVPVAEVKEPKEPKVTINDAILDIMVPGMEYTATDIVSILTTQGKPISEVHCRMQLTRLLTNGKVIRPKRGIYMKAIEI